jgi:beta-lactamase class A
MEVVRDSPRRYGIQAIACDARMSALVALLLLHFAHQLCGADTNAPAPTAFSPGLRPALVALLSTNVTGRFSVYAEGLSSGDSLGIDEDAAFNAWSLLKIPVAVTVLRRVGKGEFALDATYTWKPDELRAHTTIESNDIVGGRITVRELLRRTIALSDNRASFAMGRLFRADEFQEALGATGMPQAAPGQPRNHLPKVSPRQFANLLRSLHGARCLPPSLSQVVLDAMKRVTFDSQLPQHLPTGTAVAHMVGYNAHVGDFHDCGIVYHPRGPYILCVMSTGSTREEADAVISRASRMVYDRYEGVDERQGNR